MEAHTRSPRDLFEGKEHYEIPAFQRPYVWNEEFQWAPLWGDVLRVATAYVAAKEKCPDEPVEGHHFLGAVVYESQIKAAGDVTRHAVIDGQQRMTTLQVMLDAVHAVVAERGHEDMAESLEEVILNKSSRFKGKRERFKLWPSQADRGAFEYAMDRQGEYPDEHPLIEAHDFFLLQAQEWVVAKPDEDGEVPPGTEGLRVEALCSTLQDRLVLVAIDLTGHDDAQLIFETLNDRGTPLLKADLIKNWVFREGEKLRADVEDWAERFWGDFDTAWWREEIRQGRLTRSRVDIFLQYWLTMRRQEEVKAESAFRIFVEYAGSRMETRERAEALLGQLRRDADTYRAFAELEHDTPEGSFHHRVIERLELAVTTPVFLWLLSENHNVPSEQRRQVLAALESWALRRAVLRMTTKDINRFVVIILRVLDKVSPSDVGATLFRFLSEQTSDTRVWPSDAVLQAQLPHLRMYRSIRQDRLRVVLTAIERHLRSTSTRYETLSLPDRLEIEHVMPQGWRTHWDSTPPLDPDGAAERDHTVNTLGNLTLVTRSLNASLSNRPWTDHEAVGMTEGGRPNTGKRALLDEFSLLVLNKEIVKAGSESWTEVAIVERSRRLTQVLCQVWEGPDPEIQRVAQQDAP